MGLMRRVEPRAEKSAEAVPRMSVSEEPRRERSRRDSRYYAQPAELARKLVKEMEDHKVSHSGKETVCNYYTIFLCPEDYEHLYARMDDLVQKLQRHLVKHVQSKGYVTVGDVAVKIVRESDLAFGRFGILAERFDPTRPVSPVSVKPRTAEDSSQPLRSGSTQLIATADAAQLGLAHRIIVLKAGNRVREFSKSRVIVGRARDVDFRVDDPNVSRRHAAIFWDEGRIVVQDLDSTNGTLVNGYPVTSTVLKPNDVVVIGDCRISVESR